MVPRQRGGQSPEAELGWGGGDPTGVAVLGEERQGRLPRPGNRSEGVLKFNRQEIATFIYCLEELNIFLIDAIKQMQSSSSKPWQQSSSKTTVELLESGNMAASLTRCKSLCIFID